MKQIPPAITPPKRCERRCEELTVAVLATALAIVAAELAMVAVLSSWKREVLEEKLPLGRISSSKISSWLRPRVEARRTCIPSVVLRGCAAAGAGAGAAATSCENRRPMADPRRVIVRDGESASGAPVWLDSVPHDDDDDALAWTLRRRCCARASSAVTGKSTLGG